MGWGRKIVFAVCVLLCTSFGALLGSKDGPRGALALGLWWFMPGLVLGLFVSNIGRKDEVPVRRRGRGRKRTRTQHDELSDEEIFEMHEEMQKPTRNALLGLSQEELMANYWRDKGHPPFMNPDDYDHRS